jgi:DNA-binding response OmpR family regulator
MNIESYPYDILFIEDEKAIRDNYVEFLKRYFKNVYEAEDGEEAYKIYIEKAPDILIVDINIPKLNGIDLLKKIRQKDHRTKAIMLTAHSDTSYLLEAVGLKLTRYLVKPVTRAQLKEALNSVLEELKQYDVLPKQILVLKDGFTWNYETNELINKDEVILTEKEKKLLMLLLSNINTTYSYEDIIDELWQTFDDDKIIPLKTIIKNLRKKLPKDTIKNVFGVGYKINI